MDKKQTGKIPREQLTTELMTYIDGGTKSLIERKYIKAQLKLPLNATRNTVYSELKGMGGNELKVLLEGTKKEAIKTEAQTTTEMLEDRSELSDVPYGDIEESKIQKPVRVITQTESKKSTKSVKQDRVITQTESKKSTKSVKSESNALLDDYRMQSKIPTLKVIKQQLSQGKITRTQYDDQAVDILRNASKANKTVPALIQQIISEIISKIPKQDNYNDANALQEESKTVKANSQKTETKFSKPRSEQDGMSIENKRVGAVLPTDLTQLQDKIDAQSYVGSLLKRIQEQHPTDSDIANKLSSMHKKLTGRDLQLLEQNQVSAQESVDDEQNVHQNDNLDPLYEEQAISAQDLGRDAVYKSLVEGQIAKADLTEQQKHLARSVLFDSDSDNVIDNLSQVSDSDSDSTRIVRNPPNISKKIDSSLQSKYSRLKLVDKSGKTYGIDQILNAIPKIVDFISKIEGNIDPTHTRLSDYKRTTEIFQTAIVKRETNQFKAKQGQAFMTRACC